MPDTEGNTDEGEAWVIREIRERVVKRVGVVKGKRVVIRVRMMIEGRVRVIEVRVRMLIEVMVRVRVVIP